MYRLDTHAIPQKWLFSHGYRTRYMTDDSMAKLLHTSERTARRWRQNPDTAPRYALDYAAAVLLGHIVPDAMQARGLHFDHNHRLAFENTGESFALGCLENCDYVARLANVPEPSPCRKRRQHHACHDAAGHFQALLFSPDDLPMPRPPSGLF